MAGLATLLRRGIRRLLRFQLLHQQEFNSALYRSVALTESRLHDVSERLAALSGQVERLSQDLGPVMNRALPGLRTDVALVARSIHDLEADYDTLHATVFSQGRHVDDIETRLADASESLDEADKRGGRFEARVDEALGALAESIGDLWRRMRPRVGFDPIDLQPSFRGEEHARLERFERYAGFFSSGQRVLDIGCGRGAFLEACQGRTIGAYGVDCDPDMETRCRVKGLEVYEQDVLTHLRSLDDRSLDGIFAARVMEHLTSSELIDLLALAADKMKRGARLIIESPNVDTFSALRRFYVDPTRRQPIGVTTLHFLLTMNGFLVEEVTYLGGALDQERLQKLPTPSNVRDGDPLSVLAHRYNHNVDTLNRVLFGHQDYAVIAQR